MIQILHQKTRYETGLPIPISPISIPNRYQYPPYLPYRTDTDTGFIPIFFIQIPSIGTWYRFHTGYRSNSNTDISDRLHIKPIPIIGLNRFVPIIDRLVPPITLYTIPIPILIYEFQNLCHTDTTTYYRYNLYQFIRLSVEP